MLSNHFQEEVSRLSSRRLEINWPTPRFYLHCFCQLKTQTCSNKLAMLAWLKAWSTFYCLSTSSFEWVLIKVLKIRFHYSIDNGSLLIIEGLRASLFAVAIWVRIETELWDMVNACNIKAYCSVRYIGVPVGFVLLALGIIGCIGIACGITLYDDFLRRYNHPLYHPQSHCFDSCMYHSKNQKSSNCDPKSFVFGAGITLVIIWTLFNMSLNAMELKVMSTTKSLTKKSPYHV